MTERDEAARSEILAHLAQSREELRRLADPPREESGAAAPGDYPGGFPRSHTMRMLLSGKGLGTLGAVASGLLIARPALGVPASENGAGQRVRAHAADQGRVGLAVEKTSNRSLPRLTDTARPNGTAYRRRDVSPQSNDTFMVAAVVHQFDFAYRAR